MPVTIYDVARRAGVGIGTVSRAINDSPLIAATTKARVLKAIQELNYRPHALAQGLARNKTDMIAIILPIFTGYFFVELLRGVQEEAIRHHYDLILYSVHQTDKLELFLERTLRERRVDGVLLISLPISDRYARKFVSARVPIVLVDSFHPALDSITVENREGAYQATRHLLQLGHRRVGMIVGHLRSLPARVRLQGYRQALADSGVPVDERYVVVVDSIPGQDGFCREAGYRAMRQLLALGDERPTAVFVSSDVQAEGAMRAASEAGVRVPEDIAIVGFDDIEIAELLGLTTMHQPMLEMGRLAVDRLAERIRQPQAPRFARTFATSLVVRRSCGTHASVEGQVTIA
ncbi:MAG: LacI family DNA-binding transcriptional regulator [bacterium]|jgi:LacI family transcriptional regulator|nr:LacI family transcriptional regulator [candidate division KSB1 bacterium]MDH7560465.1 LacI family DNA-binding transcriptional regulator [bacterium]